MHFIKSKRNHLLHKMAITFVHLPLRLFFGNVKTKKQKMKIKMKEKKTKEKMKTKLDK